MKFSFAFSCPIKTPDKSFASIRERFRYLNWQRDKEDDDPREDINFILLIFPQRVKFNLILCSSGSLVIEATKKDQDLMLSNL